MKWFSRLLSHTAISFVGRRCQVLKGKASDRLLADLSDELAGSNVRRGEIWLDGNGRIRFSDEIPPELHQRLRNILTQV